MTMMMIQLEWMAHRCPSLKNLLLLADLSVVESPGHLSLYHDPVLHPLPVLDHDPVHSFANHPVGCPSTLALVAAL